MIDLQRIKTDVIALGLLAVVVFAALALISFDPADPPTDAVFPTRTVTQNFCGPTGASVAWWMRSAFGLGVWFLLIALIAADVRLFARNEPTAWTLHAFGVCLSLVSFCAALQLLHPALGSGPVVGSGGYVGAWTRDILETRFQWPGIAMLLISMFLAGMLITSESGTVNMFGRLATAPLALAAGAGGALATRFPAIERWRDRFRNEDNFDEEFEDSEEEDADEEEPDGLRVNPPVVLAAEPRVVEDADEEDLAADDDEDDYEEGEWELPSIELLEEPEEFPYELLAAKAREAAQKLEETFQLFGLNIKVVEVDTGPVITQFELDLEPGLRLKKVQALADDLAIALRVPSVRVVAPIPGKNTVGIEVPNEKQVMVRLRELIETCPTQRDEYRIPVFAGKDVSGRPMAVDIAKMPHLLIAGRTGTGKSVCLNSLILSILMTRTPDEVRMLMIDPKMVELSPYKKVPHLMYPVITDMKKAEAALAWAVDKMEERYDMLAQAGVRHLETYNKLGHDEVLERMGLDPDCEEAANVPEHMPYIVIIADEMADLMMTCGKDVETLIVRLAQKSRAVGIHLVLATQKPMVTVVTSLIKSNLPARMSFQVASQGDSRVVLDEGGAEKLLGCGDMLYLAPGTSELTRGQGAFVSDEEVHSVIDFYSEYEPQYSAELAQLSARTAAKNGSTEDRAHDDLYEDAINVVIREQRGSLSLLQRCLSIGYGRAARMIDWMAEDGIIGEHNGANARDVLFTEEEWAARAEA